MINLDFLGVMLLALTAVIVLSNTEKIKRFFRKFFSGSRDTENYVKICPKCGSTQIVVDFSNPVVWNYGTPPKYKCKKCSYIGITFPEILKEDITDYKKSMTKNFKQTATKTNKSDLLYISIGYSISIYEAAVSMVGIAFMTLIFFLGKDGNDFFILMSPIYLLFIYLGWKIYKTKIKPRS